MIFSTSTRYSDSSYVLAVTASTRSTSAVEPNRFAIITCWWRTEPTHEPDGATIASYGSKTSANRSTRGSACFWYPVLMCIWPQQVCSAGNSAAWPSRSRTRTVAFPTSGNMASARQVMNSAVFMGTSSPLLARLILRCGEGPCHQCAQLGKLALQESDRPSLDQHITDGGSLHWAS